MNYKKAFKLTLLVILFVSGIFTQIYAGIHNKIKSIDVADVQKEANAIYNKVFNHYADILPHYYKLEKVPVEEKDFYIKKLIHIIERHVKGELLPLYGNFFSRLWRNTTSCTNNLYPLKKFENLLIEDAIGHLNKYQKKCEDAGTLNDDISDLSKDLRHIQRIIKESLEWRCEDLSMGYEGMQAEISSLKKELKEVQSKYNQLKQDYNRLTVR